jgi:hypothetical protein
MKHVTFYRNNNDFTDILTDSILKKAVDEKITFKNYLILGITDDDKIFSYITLKYGESIRTNIVKDRSPVPNVDYIPIRR